MGECQGKGCRNILATRDRVLRAIGASFPILAKVFFYIGEKVGIEADAECSTGMTKVVIEVRCGMFAKSARLRQLGSATYYISRYHHYF